MSILVAVRHKTRYDYDRPVQLSPHLIRLRPAAHSRTPIHSYSLKLSPEPHFVNWQQDPFGNYWQCEYMEIPWQAICWRPVRNRWMGRYRHGGWS